MKNLEGFQLRRRTDVRSLQVNALLFSLLLTVIVSAFIIFEADRQERVVFEEAERQGSFLFSTMGFQVSDALYFNDIEQIRKDAESLTTQNSVRRISIFSESGRYLYDSSQARIPSGFIDPKLLELATSNEGALFRRENQHIEFLGTIRFDDLVLGGMYFELDVSEPLAVARDGVREAGITGGLLVILASLLSFALATMRGATKSLRNIESNFQELVEQSPLPCSIYSQDGQLRHTNPALQRLMGKRSLTETTLNSDYNVLKDRVLINIGVMPLFERGFSIEAVEVPPFNYESDQDDAISDPLWLKAAVFPLRGNNHDSREVVVVYEDVSAEKKAEQDRAELNEQVLQSQKLEGLGIMARGIAHDFNNLLTPILGNANLLEASHQQGSSQMKLINSIKSAARRASDLCDQMLAYGGRGSKSKQLTDISREVEDLKELIRSSTSKKTTFTQKLQTDLPDVMVDQTQLRAVILNLLLNASESLEGGVGEIVLTTGLRQLTTDDTHRLLPDPKLAPGPYVFLEVSDTGSGMNDEVKQKLFNPFFSTKFTGRGLGLSAVLGIVGEHRGGIAVESETDKGTTIVIYLPVDQETFDPPEPVRNRDASQKGTILLVDDEPSALEVGAIALESMGFQVVCANNGEEAIIQFRARDDIRCVVLDYLMPVLDGNQTFFELRKMRPQLPIVMISGLNVALEHRHLASQENLKILHKPYEIDDLGAALQDLLQSESESPTSHG